MLNGDRADRQNNRLTHVFLIGLNHFLNSDRWNADRSSGTAVAQQRDSRIAAEKQEDDCVRISAAEGSKNGRATGSDGLQRLLTVRRFVLP